MRIPLPKPPEGVKDIFDYAFNKNLNREVEKADNPYLWNTFFATTGFSVDMAGELVTIVPTLIPSGAVMPFGGATVPVGGWLLCDGTAYSRTFYPQLFSAIGTTYGSGDGSTTFNVPDLRGRAIIGVGTGTGGGASGNGLPSGGSALTSRVRGAWLGEETHTLAIGEMPVHSHTVNFNSSGNSSLTGGPPNIASNTSGDNSGSAGGGAAHQNMPPSMSLNFIIKT